MFRPKLFHYTWAWLGFRSVATQRAIDQSRWLAENKCIGIEVDTLPHIWLMQGLLFSLIAHLTYDPLQDAIIDSSAPSEAGLAGGERSRLP